MPWAPVNGIRLYYEMHGRGPALVFCHGAGGNHLSWWQQVPFFSQRYRCLTFDHRAFGLSEDTDGKGRRAFADDLRDLLDHLGIERAHVVAQSMGGRTAVGFALRNPGRALSLVLAGTHGGAVNDQMREAQEQYRAGPIGKRSLLERAVAPGLREERPELHFLYRSIARVNPRRPTDFLAPVPGYRGSSAERLAALDIPILFLVGEHDAITPATLIRLAHHQVPGSRFVEVPGSGHSVYFERAGAFNAEVLRFLGDASA